MPAGNEAVPDELVRYLEAHVAGFKGPVRMEKFAGGQSNPTYKLTAASGEYVLRRQPPGKLPTPRARPAISAPTSARGTAR